MPDSRAHQKRKSGGEEAAEIGNEGESARAALRPILFGQPEGIHNEIRATKTEEHGADQEPSDRILLHVEHASERQPNREHHYHIKNGERGAAAEPVRQEW